MSENVFMGKDLSVNGNVKIENNLEIGSLSVERLENLKFVGIKADENSGDDFSFNVTNNFIVHNNGNTIIGGNVDISNGLDLSGNFTLEEGTITFTGPDNKSLYIDSSANLDLSGRININNNKIELTSDGSGYFVGDLSAGGYLEIAKTTDLCNTLNVLNALTTLSDLSAYNVEISSGLIYNTTIGLTNPADASFTFVTVSNDLVVLGRSDFNNDVSMIGASLTVGNNITFANSNTNTVTSRHLGVDSGGQVTTSKLNIKDDKSNTSSNDIADFNTSLITLSQNVRLSNGKKFTLQTNGIGQTDAPITINDHAGNTTIKLHPNSNNYSQFTNDISLLGSVDLGTGSGNEVIKIGNDSTQDTLHVNADSKFYDDIILDTTNGSNTATLLVGDSNSSNTIIEKDSISLRNSTTEYITLNNDGTAIFKGDITLNNSSNINLSNANAIILTGDKIINSSGAVNLTNISGSSLYSSGYLNVNGGLTTLHSNLNVNSKSLYIETGDIAFESINKFKIYKNAGIDTILDVSTNSTKLNTNTLNLQSGTGTNDTIKFSLEKGDISNNGYIHNIGDVSLVDSRFTITKTDVSMSENVFMGQDLSVSNTVDICNTLNVLNGLTRLLELSASTVEISGGSINNTTIGLTNPADASFNYVTVANDLFVLGRSDFERDVSINGASLTVANNISGGAKLHIGGRADFYNDVSINNNKSLTVANNIHTSRILITSSVTDISTSANIQGDISAGGALNIEQGATIGGDLRVKGQNLYLSNATTSDTFDSSYSYIYGGNTIVIDPLALGDASGTVVIAGDFTVRGTTTTINSTKLDVSDVNIKLASNFTGDITDGTIKPGIDISDIVTLSVRKDHAITGKAAINTIKWKSNLGIYTESDISALSGSIDTSFVVGTLLKSNTLQVNTNNLVVDSTNDKVSTNLSLSVTKDISTNSYLYVQDYIHNIGDVSLVNNNFTITPSEVSMNPNVFMGKDLSVSNNVDICNTLTVLNGLTTLSDLSALTVQIFDGSINSTEIGLTVAADASFNYVTILDELYVGSNVKTLNNNAIITNTYSAFKLPEQPFVKEDKFVHSSSLDNSGDKWYDLSADGFKLDYTNGQSLLSSNSFVKIDVKLNYVASNEAEQFISFKLMEGSNEVKHDLSLGSVFGIGSRGIYQSSFLHQPNKLNPVYSLQFWVDRGVDQTIDISSGVIIDPSSTYFYAQELYQPEL
jgi:cytoskeletal protein CcmA (bactofilin family)